ncbi:MAG: plastocyanin [Natronomonas sp.]|jgi:plastocyanin
MNLRRRRLLRGIGGLSAVSLTTGLAGCSTDGDSGPDSDARDDPPSSVLVEMTDDLTFEPETVDVSVDGTVTWENVGAVAHSVTAYSESIPADAAYFASGEFETESDANQQYPEVGSIGRDETYEHTFETAGTYEYYCIPHESGNMVGTVTAR